MKINRIILLGVATALGLPPVVTSVRGANKEVPKDIIAVQIRKQGFECKNPESAKRDNPDSKPDEAAWILKCEGVTYRVQLIPKMAAKVEKLSDEEKPGETPQPQQQQQ
ncbi:hypothetical protein [Hyphomicrobium sp. CS1GBMeth3]|uniref:hypothetical protein n=1 Tax=Hyphomicrobium sp. CS1GBMeth3 TaxID=1892845 RepID=UPI000930286F|nr:hypothetical protein [Hyphomicrobium sp. CS1GBMeth3]